MAAIGAATVHPRRHSQTAERSSTNASWLGSSRPMLFSANIRACPSCTVGPEMQGSVDRAAATVAVLNSASRSLSIRVLQDELRENRAILPACNAFRQGQIVAPRRVDNRLHVI